MNWGAYEVFSVISGVVLIGAALLPGAPARDRAWCAIGGLILGGYGIYVANQTSGTWYFPVWIFIVPFAGVLYMVLQFAKNRDGR